MEGTHELFAVTVEWERQKVRAVNAACDEPAFNMIPVLDATQYCCRHHSRPPVPCRSLLQSVTVPHAGCQAACPQACRTLAPWYPRRCSHWANFKAALRFKGRKRLSAVNINGNGKALVRSASLRPSPFFFQSLGGRSFSLHVGISLRLMFPHCFECVIVCYFRLGWRGARLCALALGT